MLRTIGNMNCKLNIEGIAQAKHLCTTKRGSYLEVCAQDFAISRSDLQKKFQFKAKTLTFSTAPPALRIEENWRKTPSTKSPGRRSKIL